MEPMTLIPDLLEFVRLLNSHEVKYLVVGGFAVAYHHMPRFTGDIDFWVEPSIENGEKLVRVMADFGFSSWKLTPEHFATSDQVVQMGVPPNRIDLITDMVGCDFADCWARRVDDDLCGVATHYIPFDDLLRNKELVDRPKDRRDVRNLRKTRNDP